MTELMLVFVIQVGIIVFAAKIGNLIFEKLKLPGLLGELLIGILIGPYLLGSIPLPISGFENGVFPLNQEFPISKELYGLCTIASIVLLFNVGLETDIKLFLKYSVAGFFIGLGGVLGSFILGILAAYIYKVFILKTSFIFTSPSTLFLGVMSTATSVGITARILSERKKLETPEGVSILSAAVVDDVLGIIFLAIILGVVNSSSNSNKIDWVKISLVGIKAISVWLGATFIGLLLSQKLSKTLKLFKHKVSISIMALGLSLIVAGLFEEAGLALIIGAYVTGISLSNTDISILIREMLQPISEFLIPIFFCVMGMLVNIKEMININVLTFGIIFLILAILGKVIGCGFPSLFFNFNFIGALRIGSGMIPRGEVALIIAGIGIASGFISQEIFGVSIFMTLFTTMIAPILMLKLFLNPKSGYKVNKTEEETYKTTTYQFPNEDITNLVLGYILKMFEEEGFFIHIINQAEEIYNVRKDTSFITIEKEEDRIILSYFNDDDLKLINAIFIEVIANVEKTIKSLQKPIDTKKAIEQFIGSDNIEDKIQNKKFASEYASYFSKLLIIPDLKASTKEEVIRELVDRIILFNPGYDKDLIIKDIIERERSMSTGMQYGIALPHAKTQAVDKLICAVGISKKGIDFNSLDKKPSYIFFMVLSPKGENVSHLKFMAYIASILTAERREKLINAKTIDEIYNIIIE
ncbi:MAG: cation:proton antiporter [Spirochaetes bacterium]|nr:cation:proton antiporter [Spirochaetota bacterium]